MSRQIQRTSTRARVLIVGVAGAVGFAAMYFFDPQEGARRRQAAYRWLERKGDGLWRRSNGVAGRPGEAPSWEPAAAPSQAATAPESAEDLAAALRREVTFVTVEAGGPPPDDELAPVTALGSPSTAARAGAYEDGGAEPASRFVHVEAPARPSPRIIAYDEPAAHEDEPDRTREVPVATPPRRRTGLRLVLASATAAALGVGAAALGAWLVWPEDEGNDAPAVQPGAAAAIELISQPGARRVPVGGSNGAMVLVVAPNGQAVLIVSGLPRAPAGKEYQAWVVEGPKPKSAGLFRGGEARIVIPLGRKVPRGAVVAVTLERAGGVPAPTQKPKYVATLA